MELDSPEIHTFVKNGKEYRTNALFASPMALYQNQIFMIFDNFEKVLRRKKLTMAVFSRFLGDWITLWQTGRDLGIILECYAKIMEEFRYFW